MFSSLKKENKKTEGETQRAVLSLVRPIASLPKTENAPLDDYEALAGELGFRPAQLLKEQVLRFLAEQGIPIFDYGEVDRYLTNTVKQTEENWIWRPLREQDKLEHGWSGHCPEGTILTRGHGSYHNEWGYRPYDKAVPLPILKQVKTIQDRLGDQVSFFVSDYAAVNPDPFIMLTAVDLGIIVFGVWDEPGFGV
ncbi:MAG: hypothetical protein HY764_03445 [Candidatus Portnoybacteria bacterium]|nr:hypothetical protein [Candidatus Portnoybacteria bacterium]